MDNTRPLAAGSLDVELERASLEDLLDICGRHLEQLVERDRESIFKSFKPLGTVGSNGI